MYRSRCDAVEIVVGHARRSSVHDVMTPFEVAVVTSSDSQSENLGVPPGESAVYGQRGRPLDERAEEFLVVGHHRKDVQGPLALAHAAADFEGCRSPHRAAES